MQVLELVISLTFTGTFTFTGLKKEGL